MTSALFLALSTASFAAPSRVFSCEQLTLTGDPTLDQHVDFAVDAADVPGAVRITNVASGLVDLQTRSPAYRPNYDGGYWFTNYGLDAYKVGTVGGWTTYVWLIPTGALGAQFDAQLHLWWDRGAAGWWANEFHCVEVP